jgi:hypothetical protein
MRLGPFMLSLHPPVRPFGAALAEAMEKALVRAPR